VNVVAGDEKNRVGGDRMPTAFGEKTGTPLA
jgi:hypothetical protein